MKFLVKVFLFALIALIGFAAGKQTEEEIKDYEKRCEAHGLEKDCWVTGPTTVAGAEVSHVPLRQTFKPPQ
uniref:Uncharacterized protein n=1 Tax=Anopheles funestus TaxID=62324 RepID=A0A182R5A1_ANOFN